jgi:hypothetical protein
MLVLVAMRVQGWSSVARAQVSLFDPQVVVHAAGLTSANLDLTASIGTEDRGL